MMERRAFLTAASALAACAAIPAMASEGRKIRLAAQMYSLRDITKDVHGLYAMLRLMREFGYTGVELTDVKGPPEALKKFMDDIGLACAGVHLWYDACLPKEMERTCARCRAYGVTNLVMPCAFPPKGCADEKGWWKRLGADLSASAEIARRNGCTLAYHNHGHEFTKTVGGEKVWNLIQSEATDDLKLQLDLAHLLNAGVDIPAWIARYPNRVVSLHAGGVCSPWSRPRPEPGKRGIDWTKVFDAARANAVEWVIVEDFGDAADTLKMKRGADFLRKCAPFLG